MIRWVLVLTLTVLVSIASVSTAHAELPSETINDIQVPGNVTWGAQIEWQGHIVYGVKDVGPTYQVKIARDGEPHQYPYFYVSFSKEWEYLGTTRHVNPEADKKAAEDAARKQQEDAQRAEQQRVDQERQKREAQDRAAREQAERERQQGRENPPVVPKPEEPVEPEEPPEDPGESGE